MPVRSFVGVAVLGVVSISLLLAFGETAAAHRDDRIFQFECRADEREALGASRVVDWGRDNAQQGSLRGVAAYVVSCTLAKGREVRVKVGHPEQDPTYGYCWVVARPYLSLWVDHRKVLSAEPLSTCGWDEVDVATRTVLAGFRVDDATVSICWSEVSAEGRRSSPRCESVDILLLPIDQREYPSAGQSRMPPGTVVMRAAADARFCSAFVSDTKAGLDLSQPEGWPRVSVPVEPPFTVPLWSVVSPEGSRRDIMPGIVERVDVDIDNDGIVERVYRHSLDVPRHPFHRYWVVDPANDPVAIAEWGSPASLADRAPVLAELLALPIKLAAPKSGRARADDHEAQLRRRSPFGADAWESEILLHKGTTYVFWRHPYYRPPYAGPDPVLIGTLQRPLPTGGAAPVCEFLVEPDNF